MSFFPNNNSKVFNRKFMKIPFYKCNSKGNDFIIVPFLKNHESYFFTEKKIREICNYKSEYLTRYNEHCMTKKHLRNIEKVEKKQQYKIKKNE